MTERVEDRARHFFEALHDPGGERARNTFA